MHPSNIWDSYFSVLEDKFNIVLSDELKTQISSDNRNLRDRERFNDYVNQVFFTRGKLDHVQLEQQLLVIYAYLFYPKLYKILLEGNIINSNDFEKVEKKILELREVDSEKYPLCFKRNRIGYLIYEASSNRTKDELDILFDNMSEDLENELVKSEGFTDFYQYLYTQFRTFSENQQKQLFEIAIKESVKFKNSDSMDFIIQERFWELYNSDDGEATVPMELDGDAFIPKQIKRIEDIFKPMGYDQSQIIYILEKHDIMSFHELGLYYSDLRIDTETFSNLRRKDFFLLTYLSSKDLSEKFKYWDNTIWEAIELFDDREFLSFWIFQSIITNELGYEGFDIIPENKSYTIWIGKYDIEYPHDYIDYMESVISKIKPRIEKMEKEGFIFTEKIDERHKR